MGGRVSTNFSTTAHERDAAEHPALAEPVSGPKGVANAFGEALVIDVAPADPDRYRRTTMKLVIDHIHETEFPPLCVVCGDPHPVWVEARTSEGTDLWPTPILPMYATRVSMIRFPLCERHRRRTRLSRLLSRRRLWVLVLMVVLWIWLCFGLLIQVAILVSDPAPGVPAGFGEPTLLATVGIPLPLVIIRLAARRRSPLTLMRVDASGTGTLLLRNRDYARALRDANPLLVRAPFD